MFSSVLLLAALLSIVTSDNAPMKAYYTYITSSSVQLISASVLTQNSNGYVDGATVNMGVKSTATSSFMTDSTSFRVNTLSELYVSIAVQQLMTKGLNGGNLPSYMPKSVSLVNSGVTITLQMLLQHQSGLADSPYDTFTVNAPTGVTSLTTFCDNYFTTAGTNGAFNQASNLFSGVTGNYSYSRMNTVLLTCIVENYVSANKLVGSGPHTAAAYMQNLIFNPLGMSNTFTLNSTGGLPTSTYPLGAPIYGGSLVQDLPSGSSNSINPGYSADLMYYTSTADLASFVRSMFITSLPVGIFSAFGTTMKTPMSSFSFSSAIPGVTGQTTYSLYTFDGSAMCALAVNSGAETSCPLSSTSLVYGYVSRGRFSAVGFFCTTAQSATSPTCVNVQFSHYDVGLSPSAAVVTRQYQLLLGMAAVAFTESIGPSSLSLLYLGPGKTTDLYGLYVFIGVSGIVAFVLAASYVTEYLVQPAPIATGLPPPLTLPQHMYPPSFQGPPLPRHDFYAQ